MNIEQARLLTLKTAWMMDHTSPKEARIWISMIKTVVPNMALKVIDDAIQMHGGIGVSQDTPGRNVVGTAHSAPRRRARRGAPHGGGAQ